MPEKWESDQPQTGNPSAMRRMNMRIMYDAIYRMGVISRAELTKLTGLRAPTVSDIMRQLVSEGYIIPCGKGEKNPNGGPQPELYRINCVDTGFIGIDICAEHLTGVLLGADLQCVHQQSVPMEDAMRTQGDRLGEALEALIAALLSEGTRAGLTTRGIGVSASGLVDHEEGMVTLSAIPSLNGFPFHRRIFEAFHLAPYVDNDINILLSDLQSTSAPLSAAGSILCIGIRNSGTGMSLSTGGTLYRGNGNRSGNITLFPTRASVEEVLAAVQAHLMAHPDFDRARLGLVPGEALGPRHLAHALSQKDQEVTALIETALSGMNTCCAMLQRLFDAEYVVLACPLFSEENTLFEYMRDAASTLCGEPYAQTQYIKLPLSDLDFARYAAQCAFRQLYEHAVP